MANYKTVFLGTGKTNDCELQCFALNNNEIFISLEDNYIQHICIDISTAIKLAKTLRTHINIAKEGNNG
jgi:hypothetical protein